MAVQSILEGTKDPLQGVVDQIYAYLAKSPDTRLDVARELLQKITSEFKNQFPELFPNLDYKEFERFMSVRVLPLTSKVSSPSKSIIDRNLSQEEIKGIESAVQSIRGLSPEYIKAAIHFSTKIVQGINISQEVERINRVQKSDKTRRAYEGLTSLADTEYFFNRTEIVVFTAHPNKAISDDIQLLLNTITNNLLEGRSLTTEIRELVRAPVLSSTKPSPQEEASSFIRLLRKSLFPGAIQFLRESFKILDRIGIRSTDRIPEARTWIGSDLDGRPDHTPEDLRAILIANRREGIDTYKEELRKLETLKVNQSTLFHEKFNKLIDDLESARDLFNSKFTSDQFVGSLNELQVLVDENPELELELLCLREVALKFGLSLVRHELRENSEVLDSAIEPVLKAYGYSDLSKEKRGDGELISDPDEKLIAIEEILLSGEIKDSINSNPAFNRLIGFLNVVKEANQKDPGLFRQFIISLHEHPVHYLQTSLICKLAGIEDLDLVPLTETPEDLRKVGEVARRIFDSKVSSLKGKITWMWGFSDSAMRGGFCSRELTRTAPDQVSKIGEEFGITVFHEEGRGPRSGRGGGLYTRFVWATNQNLRTNRNHVTIQGEGVQQLFGHPNMVQRTLSIGSERFIAAKFKKLPDEWSTLRSRAFSKGEKAYEEFIDRVPGGDPQEVFKELQKIIPLLALDLKTASRPLFRSLPVEFEKFRAVPNNIMSDVSRLCWVTLYGTGAMMEELTDNFDLTKQMIAEDVEFRSDVESLILALQRADVPRVVAIVRAVYGEGIGKLEEILSKIESDYQKLYIALNKLNDSGALETIFVRRTFEAIREARTLKDPATNLFLICLMLHKDSELRKMIMVHNMLSVDSAG